jgi:hypothetical protein
MGDGTAAPATPRRSGVASEAVPKGPHPKAAWPEPAPYLSTVLRPFGSWPVLRRRLFAGQREVERGALAELAFDTGLDDVLHDTESQSRAALVAGAGIVHLVKPVEDAITRFGRSSHRPRHQMHGMAKLPPCQPDAAGSATNRYGKIGTKPPSCVAKPCLAKYLSGVSSRSA